MTYRMLKSLTTGLLINDSVLPVDQDILSELVKYALVTVATKAESLHLMTLSTTTPVLRLAHGDYLIRYPEAPVLDTDDIDIDDELVAAVARYLASYVSRERGGIHVDAANKIILDYNGKTYEILDQMANEAAYADVIGTESSDYSTEWSL